MKKGNILRSIFWGLIMLVLLAGGIVGLSYNIQSFKNNEGDLKRIITIFNNNSTIKDYDKVDAKIEAVLKGKNIIVTYELATKKTYTFTFKRTYLETNIESEDTIGKVIVMALADSIAVNKGALEGDTYSLFSSENINNLTLKDGIEIETINDRQTIKISLENSIKNTSLN